MNTTQKSQQAEEEIADLEVRIKAQKEIARKLLEDREPLKTVYTWSAPERVYSPKDRAWYVAIAGGALVVIVLAALTNNFGLIFALVALILYIYASNTIPPKNIDLEITNKGLKVEKEFYQWRTVVSFWVTEREKHLLLHFELRLRETDRLTSRLIILVGKGDPKSIVKSIVPYVDYLSETEIRSNIFSRLMEGVYHPLLQFIEGEDVQTKDPKDNPRLHKLDEKDLPKTEHTQTKQEPKPAEATAK